MYKNKVLSEPHAPIGRRWSPFL